MSGVFLLVSGDLPVIGDEVEVDPGHEGPHHLQTLTGELWVGLLVGLQDLEPGLHQAGDALLPHGVLDQSVSTSLLRETYEITLTLASEVSDSQRKNMTQ